MGHELSSNKISLFKCERLSGTSRLCRNALLNRCFHDSNPSTAAVIGAFYHGLQDIEQCVGDGMMRECRTEGRAKLERALDLGVYQSGWQQYWTRLRTCLAVLENAGAVRCIADLLLLYFIFSVSSDLRGLTHRFGSAATNVTFGTRSKLMNCVPFIINNWQ